MQDPIAVSLIIDGVDVRAPSNGCVFEANCSVASQDDKILIQGADPNLCVLAVESCSRAFQKWKKTSPERRRKLLQRLAQLIRDRADEIRSLIESEIDSSRQWSEINLEAALDLVEEMAALVTSETMAGSIPVTNNRKAQPMIFKEPLGVVLGIAPWNSPLVLGLRAVVPPIAAGNTAILKGSELSPRIHYYIAKLFQEAGFPPGVLNFILHRPQDASLTFESMISHPAVRKCNFTGSTPVGKLIASRAAAVLKPVLLELGGKNFAIVMEDADLDKAAQLILAGAFLNNGQICMSTDIVLVSRPILPEFRERLLSLLDNASSDVTNVITQKSCSRLQSLLEDAESKGAVLTKGTNKNKPPIPATLIEGLTPEMDFYHSESFGPLLGIMAFDKDEEALRIVNSCPFGLSAAIFTRNHFHGIQLARELNDGAIHINGSTVHDEATLPHGGRGDSGWGRFGAHWGLQEFLQTKTIILNR
ncbi:aldehyde dehydrogenase, putative [Talaromyces stipitatus ATCC 10500]|uniref:Aldehyde dehydrogenase, putative n=1 Tax=Talaromyces stipitatus (strain ATCC 10500 / CBS 375.48 / QM 6759 / NRRL 1006) TaxID=441959 RepID=B8MGF1_TALSN|nr:aldehyde dehydrogenase, putative [Talaromyces stipitatus ATCC 10500]EED16271.1 aldehyde dehydrogenase, putative [Talaromyces stipitatus ATCC 10500]